MCKNKQILKKRQHQGIYFESIAFKPEQMSLNASLIRNNSGKPCLQRRPRYWIAGLHPQLGCQGLGTRCRTQRAYRITPAGPPAETQSAKNSCSSDFGLSSQAHHFGRAINVQRKSRGTRRQNLCIPELKCQLKALGLCCVFAWGCHHSQPFVILQLYTEGRCCALCERAGLPSGTKLL